MRRVEPRGEAQLRRQAARVRWARLAGIFFLAITEAMAQEKPAQKQPAAPRNSREPVRRIVVSIPDRKLALIEDGRAVKVYPVAVGAPHTPSPSGKFRIARRVSNPTYYHDGEVIPPGPANPVGPRWIGLSAAGYGIHGTNRPRSIGRRASHGCIRMRNPDVVDLFERVRVGDSVELHGSRDAEVARLFGGEPSETVAVAEAVAESGDANR